MDEKGDWEHFAASGKVMDYLEYKGCIGRAQNMPDTMTGPDITGNVFWSEKTADKEEQHSLTGRAR